MADTRKSNFPSGLGTPHLSANVARDFPVLESPCIPSGVDAIAYSLNFTAIPYPALGDGLGFLEVWPTGYQPANPVSTLNNLTGTYVANAALVPAGNSGENQPLIACRSCLSDGQLRRGLDEVLLGVAIG